MTETFLKTAAKIGFFLALTAAVGSIFLGRSFVWAGGVLTAACWMFLNVYFLFRLLSVGMRIEVKKNPNHILVLSVLKFPVIYLAGYFILKTRYFPMESILAGLTAFMAGLIISWALHQRKNIRLQTKTLICFPLLFIFCLLSAVCSLQSSAIASEQVAHESRTASHESHDAKHDSALHTTNLVGLVGRFLPDGAAKVLNGYENLIFGILVIVILSLIFFMASRNMKLVPGRLQSACESVAEGLNGFVCGIIGPEGRKYTPFLGTLFLYILTMNLLGLIPLMKSNTANSMTLAGPVALPVPTTTVALALIVFVTVQFIGIQKQGIVGYLDHMAGSPRDVFGFVMAPLMFPIHLIGELAKPFSLTFRLFCNIMGGHILVAVFIGMGVGAMFIPFQVPFLLFEIATSTIQAFVFTLLSTVYIAMMMPHGDHEKHHHAAEVHH